MVKGALGRVYEDGEVLIRQGETGDCMFVIQEGEVLVIREEKQGEVLLRTLGEGEIIGEMAVFEHDVRSATVRARGRVRALTIDKRTFLQRVSADPSVAFRLVKMMSHRIRELSTELARLQQRNF